MRLRLFSIRDPDQSASAMKYMGSSVVVEQHAGIEF
jgi:hypothetical protein